MHRISGYIFGLLLIPVVGFGEEIGRAQNKIFLFTQTYCPSCIHIKQYMNEKNISFIELDIETNPEALKAFKRIKGRGTPLLVINKQIKYGFDPAFIQNNLYK
jgi:glutaredoxin